MAEILTRGLCHVYSADTPFEKVAIENVALTIPQGQLAAIIGHAGSGKADGHGHGHGQRDKPALESAGLGAGLLRVLLGIESSGSSHHSPICGSSQVSV